MKALLVDLNNFARYPTLAIGYLVAGLRRDGVEVDVLSPLAHGVPATEREHQERWRDDLQRRIQFSSLSRSADWYDTLRNVRKRWPLRQTSRIVREAEAAIARLRPDVLLLSAYLDHFPTVMALGQSAQARGIPVLLGGPMFNQPSVAKEWLGIPGLAAIMGGEADLTIGAITRAVVNRDDLSQTNGMYLPDGREGPPALPLRDLARLPVPDFTDFPWDRYPHPVIPVMTGRGCAWGRCRFCSDVVTANGRTFRSRGVEAVLNEVADQASRHHTRDVIFLDIKLNSDLTMWRGIIDGFQDVLPGGRFIGTVHVDAVGENGLTATELVRARTAGLTRMTFGLESGSQRLNDSMAKGTKLERTSEFLRDAARSRISMRTTVMLGYPGERATDVRATVDFLGKHIECLDRVRLSRFKAIPGTKFQESWDAGPSRYPDIRGLQWDHRYARAAYTFAPAYDADYRAAKVQLLKLVHSINRKPLRDGAQVFDGLM